MIQGKNRTTIIIKVLDSFYILREYLKLSLKINTHFDNKK